MAIQALRDSCSKWSRGVEIHTLGRFAITLVGADGRRKEVPAGALSHGHAKSLLKLLLSQANSSITREKAIAVLWPKDRGERGGKLLSNAIWNVRKGLCSTNDGTYTLVATRDGSVALRQVTEWSDTLDGCWIDAKAFERACQQVALTHRDDERLQAAQQALDLYQGDFLPEALYDDWTSGRRERLHEQWIGVGIIAAEILARTGRTESALHVLHTMLELMPTHSGIALRAMHIYACSGRPDDALATFKMTRRAVRQVGETVPGELRRLAKRIGEGM